MTTDQTSALEEQRRAKPATFGRAAPPRRQRSQSDRDSLVGAIQVPVGMLTLIALPALWAETAFRALDGYWDSWPQLTVAALAAALNIPLLWFMLST